VTSIVWIKVFYIELVALPNESTCIITYVREGMAVTRTICTEKEVVV
jgi:hypothetical protein